MTSRRNFLKAAAATAATNGFPTIVPATVFGATAPSSRIHIGAIGVGRISRGHDMPGVWQYTGVASRDKRIVAVCDLSANRVKLAQKLVDGTYTKKLGQNYTGTRVYADYRELLAQSDIDAVLISTPDHQHARLCVAALKARKDVYLQKPASLTIAEGRIMADHAAASKQIVQVGWQQRSWKQFTRAVELVRNGRIGTVKEVEIGLPGDPAGSAGCHGELGWRCKAGAYCAPTCFESKGAGFCDWAQRVACVHGRRPSRQLAGLREEPQGEYRDGRNRAPRMFHLLAALDGNKNRSSHPLGSEDRNGDGR